MSFADYEVSVEDGRPITLFKFTLGSTVWRFNDTANQVVTTDGYVWYPSPVSYDGVKQSGEAVTDSLNITMPMNAAPVQLYKISPPSTVMGVMIYEKHEDTDPVVVYVGDIQQVGFPTPATATFTCQAISASMKVEGLRLCWQRACPYVVYDEATCKVNPAAFMTPVTITAISGNTITVTPDAGYTFSTSKHAGGFMSWTDPVKGLEILAIESQSGYNLNLFGVADNLYVGLKVNAYQGCNQSLARCNEFGNGDNFGGDPYLPGKSPFDSNLIY